MSAIITNPLTSMRRRPAAHRSLRVLVLDEEVPLPANSGKRIRTWNLLRRLAEQHNVTFLAHGEPESSSRQEFSRRGIALVLAPPLPRRRGISLYADLLRNCFSAQPYSVAKHHTAAFRRELEHLLATQSFDLIHCEWTPYASYVGESPIPVVIATHNIEAQILARRAAQQTKLPAKAFFSWQARKMQSFERRVFARADWVTAVSAEDLQTVRAWGAASTALIENGVDIEQFTPAPLQRSDDLLFLGSLDWFPNVHGVSWFIEEVLPRVREQIPQTKLRIVGRAPSAELQRDVCRWFGVELVGEVADVRTYLHKAAMLVVPLHIGGGSRIKILEALACETPVVSTTIGAEGLALRNGVHLRIGDSAEQFAAEVGRLLADRQEAARLAHNGRALVQQRYSWDKLAQELDSVWQKVAALSIRRTA